MLLKGSCNDILEISLHSGKKPVRLQMGPKSYSYLPFVEALSLFYNNDMSQILTINRDGSHPRDQPIREQGLDLESNLDAFLVACDNESESDEEEDEEPFDYYILSKNASKTNDPVTDQDRVPANDDICAINSLIEALTNAQLQRTSNELACNDKKSASSQEEYCSILIKSEIQTLSFFLAVSKVLKYQLDQLLETSTIAPLKPEYVLDKLGLVSNDMITKYVADVANAFLAIRYPKRGQ